jgi:D-lactate dehydrogenase
VTEDRAAGTPDALREDLIGLLGDGKLLHEISDLVKYASDASPCRFVPQVVVIAETLDDVAAVLRYASEHHREIVFRAAGTSLNGQSQGEDILVDMRRHWTGVEVLDGGAQVRIKAGTTVWRASTSEQLARIARCPLLVVPHAVAQHEFEVEESSTGASA